MSEQVREHYFLVVRVLIVLIIELYIIVNRTATAEPSEKMLLLLALFLGSVVAGGVIPKKYRASMLVVMGLLLVCFICFEGWEHILLGIFWIYELISYFRLNFILYFIPVALVFVPSQNDMVISVLIMGFIGMIYVQHEFIVRSYREQAEEDSLTELKLKKSMTEKEMEFRDKLNQSLLSAENQILDEKSRLAQKLHDKLGHSINGSIYQLEAVKVVMESKPEDARNMIQAVINQLRTGMDEIRTILREGRPDKYKLTILQLQRLCDECKHAGIEAVLDINGNLAEIPDKYLEIILDNVYEGVTNALKYSKCNKIDILIRVMNRMIRCRISDNGVGCKEIIDGMGISGMRRRMRNVNGILDFETEAGFAINMLLPIDEE